MEKQDHILKRDQRVKLKDGFDAMYQVARSGAQGIVKEVEYDPYGFPCALVQWDTDHWTYEGEQDGWTFQSHFELVKDSSMTEEPDAELMRRLYHAVKAEIEAEQDKQSGFDERYPEARAAAVEALDSGTESFIIITVKRGLNPEDGSITLDPQIVSYSSSEEGRLAIEAQMLILSGMGHEQLIANRIGKIMEGGE